jgi:hypothetical protein
MASSNSEIKLLFVSFLYSNYYILRYDFNKFCIDLSFVEKFPVFLIELFVSHRWVS